MISRKNTLQSLRILISVLLIGYLLATVDLGELLTVLKSLNIGYFLASVFSGFLHNVIFAYRWKIIIARSGIQVPFLTLIKFYFGGAFFNLVLPTALGGDLVRGYDLAIHSGKKMDAAASVLTERIIGFSALISIALFALLFGHSMIDNPIVTIVILIVCISYFILVIIVFNARIIKKLTSVFKFITIWNIGKRIEKMQRSLRAFTASKAVLCQCFALSIICQIIMILAGYLLALAINLRLPVVYFFMILPMIWVITMFPLSINGLGVREGSYVFFFTKVGVSNSMALLLSFLAISRIIILGLIGGVIYLAGQIPLPYKKSTKEYTQLKKKKSGAG